MIRGSGDGCLLSASAGGSGFPYPPTPGCCCSPRVMGKEAETHLQSILLGLQGGDRDSGTRQAGAAASTKHPGTGQRRWVAQAVVLQWENHPRESPSSHPRSTTRAATSQICGPGSRFGDFRNATGSNRALGNSSQNLQRVGGIRAK